LAASLLELRPQDLTLEAVKMSEDGQHLVVRIANLRSEPRTAQLRCSLPLARAEIARLDETPTGVQVGIDAEWVDFCHGVDLMIHDAQYIEDDMPAKHGWGHSLISQVRQLAVDAQVKNIVMYHHDPERTDSELDEIAIESARFFKSRNSTIGSYIAAEGLSFELKSKQDTRVSTLRLHENA